MTTKPTATVREIDGQLVLDDPDSIAVITAIERENVRQLIASPEQRDRIAHFVKRIAVRAPELGLQEHELTVVHLCVDDPNGAALADELMPGHDWNGIRAAGQVPYARWIAVRDGLQALLDEVFPGIAPTLREIPGIAVVAMDRGVVAVFAAAALLAEPSPTYEIVVRDGKYHYDSSNDPHADDCACDSCCPMPGGAR